MSHYPHYAAAFAKEHGVRVIPMGEVRGRGLMIGVEFAHPKTADANGTDARHQLGTAVATVADGMGADLAEIDELELGKSAHAA